MTTKTIFLLATLILSSAWAAPANAQDDAPSPHLNLEFLTVVLLMPAFGITGEVIRAQAFTTDGLWIDQPQRALAFGFLYFVSLGISELVSHRWLPDAHIPRNKALSEAPS